MIGMRSKNQFRCGPICDMALQNKIQIISSPTHPKNRPIFISFSEKVQNTSHRTPSSLPKSQRSPVSPFPGKVRSGTRLSLAYDSTPLRQQQIMWNILRRVSLTKQFTEGAAIRPEDFQLPHRQNMNLLTAMFEIRKWFIFNSPHKYYSQRYTNDMTHLHNELNYQHARLLIRRGALVFALIYAYFWVVNEPDAIDWKDTFDIKMNERTYGTLTTSAGEGGASIDE